MSHYVINASKVIELMNCFSSSDEALDFVIEFSQLIDDCLLTKEEAEKHIYDINSQMKCFSKEVIMIVMFFRKNIDLIQQLAKVIDCKEIKNEDLEGYKNLDSAEEI